MTGWPPPNRYLIVVMSLLLMLGSTQIRAKKSKSIDWASLGYPGHEDLEVWEKIAPFLEPHDSERSRILQEIFSVRYRVLANEDTLKAAGFIASSVRSTSLYTHSRAFPAKEPYRSSGR